MTDADGQKRDAAHAAVERFVHSGATIGLGSGTTSAFVVRRIGGLLNAGELRGLRGIPTSESTAALAREVGIPTVSLSEARPTLTLDGADEIGPGLAAVKGLGGALLREKIVAAASTQGLVLVADASKAVDALGTRAPIPVEVDPFGWQATLEALSTLGCQPRLRMDAADPQHPFVTDGGHYTADCAFEGIEDPAALEAAIKAIPGALECGLFVGLALAAVVAGGDGIRILEK
ncbi:MAG: ribose-5-phosphate isomerase RpiA [Actinomycetota bacterium]|nr:ribose-5-phosphate isomerase RpiA [Actinomycetota bacterium]